MVRSVNYEQAVVQEITFLAHHSTVSSARMSVS